MMMLTQRCSLVAALGGLMMCGMVTAGLVGCELDQDYAVYDAQVQIIEDDAAADRDWGVRPVMDATDSEVIAVDAHQFNTAVAYDAAAEPAARVNAGMSAGERVELPIPDDSPIRAQLEAARDAVQQVVDVPDSQRTFKNTIWAVDDIAARLDFDTGMTLFMAYVSPDAAQRERGERAQQDLSAFVIELSKNEALYNAVKSYAAKNEALSGEKARLLRFMLRDYRRAGMDLTAAQREELKAIEKEIADLSIEFEKNIRTDETAVFVTRDELAGMSDDYIKELDRAGGLYTITMDYPTFLPLMDMADNEHTRQEVWVAYKRRGGKKNIAVIEKIIKLRADAARLLGYRHPADYENEVRMSKNADEIEAFYAKLRPLVRKKAEKDWAEFNAAKREDTGDAGATLKPWDFSYYQNYLMKKKYAVDTEKVRDYFPMNRVTEGLFSITQSLYGLRYEEVTDRADSLGMPLWHEDVRLFKVFDTGSGDELGMFYIDLHPRDNKYGHAAQWGLRQHKLWRDGTYAKPLAALVCNFSKPTADKPSRMSHDEVETYFHEFGHCLHTILSEADFYQFAGTSVERDFVEAPSQMFENWVWDADVLNTFAAHYQTGELIPEEILDGMIAAKNLGSGMLAEHQFYYGMTDLMYHMDPEGDADTTKIATDLFHDVELYDEVPGVWHQASFGHLTGYQAGYYGYQWSLVYASDMFQRFKELGMLDPEAGKYYRDKILARGGTVDGLEMVEEYLGREPDMAAFLRHLGLEE